MSDESPMFQVPPTRRHAQNAGLLLSIPQHAGPTGPTKPGAVADPTGSSVPNAAVPLPYIPEPAARGPRRKPVPLDFAQIEGLLSHQPGAAPAAGSTAIQRALNAGSRELPAQATAPATGVTSATLLDHVTPEEWTFLANSGQIDELSKLGEGNGGSVSKCVLRCGLPVFALKLISADPNPDVQKQIIRELQYNRLCHSPNIVKYYGTFLVERQLMIGIAMEYMGGGTLDAIYKRVLALDPTNRVSEKVLGKVAESVLKGLEYLHLQKIIHRDIKPSNILFDTQGHVKICDFGVSGDVVNSLATTFVGTQYYMAPERIMGQPYTVSCDVWLLGVSLLEVAQGRFPFVAQNANPVGPIELLLLILECEPRLDDTPAELIFWLDSFRNFLGYCLKKAPGDRPGPLQILQHPWCIGQLRFNVNMEKFVRKVWEAQTG